MTIDISVVVPFLNEEHYIRQCVDSLLATEYPSDRVEFLFVDNGSTDDGPRILGEYPRVTLLTEPRGQTYTARNRALEAASGEVIAFTDADCVVGARWLAVIHDAVLRDGATFAMGPVFFPKPKSEFLEILETYRNDHIEFVIENEIWNHVYGYTNNMAVRADVFDRIGPFAELPIPGDTEIIHRCLKQFPETEIAFCPDMWIEHLELLSAGVLFRKLMHYGEFDTYRPRMQYDPPHHRELSGAETHTVRKNRYSIRQRVLFQIGLKASNTCLWYGNQRGRLRRAWRRFRGAPA